MIVYHASFRGSRCGFAPAGTTGFGFPCERLNTIHYLLQQVEAFPCRKLTHTHTHASYVKFTHLPFLRVFVVFLYHLFISLCYRLFIFFFTHLCPLILTCFFHMIQFVPFLFFYHMIHLFSCVFYKCIFSVVCYK